MTCGILETPGSSDAKFIMESNKGLLTLAPLLNPSNFLNNGREIRTVHILVKPLRVRKIKSSNIGLIGRGMMIRSGLYMFNKVGNIHTGVLSNHRGIDGLIRIGQCTISS